MHRSTSTKQVAECNLEHGVAPLCISMMIACYVSPDPRSEVGEGVWASQAGDEVRRWLLDNGLIDANARATERGEAWIRFICETPLPVHVWQRP